eukprot:jgi/Botrbrau1/8498/Bobra.0029s0006.1
MYAGLHSLLTVVEGLICVLDGVLSQVETLALECLLCVGGGGRRAVVMTWSRLRFRDNPQIDENLCLMQRLQGLLNQAIIAQEDVEGYFVIRRVSFIIAAAVGRQLAARRVTALLRRTRTGRPPGGSRMSVGYRKHDIAISKLIYTILFITTLPRGSDSALEDVVFTPGSAILDDRGQLVHAHGGRLVTQPDNSFLWVGEGAKPGCNVSTTPRGAGCNNFEAEVSNAFNLYRSRDLVHWTWLGEVLTRVDVTDVNCYPSCRMERPKLVQDKVNGGYVILFHVAHLNFSYNAVGVARDAPRIAVSPLTLDLMDVGPACNYYTAGKAEAPTIFRVGSMVMMLLSHQTWWDPNPAILTSSSNICPGVEGSQFTAISTPVDGERAATTMDSQPVQVFSFPCSNGHSFFMYMGDRWNFRGENGLAGATYVWLPLLPRIDEDPAQGYVIVDRAAWSPRDYCGPELSQRRRARHRRREAT